MLSISLTDLLPEAAAEIGFVQANISFYIGVAFFALVVHIIPEPEILVRGNTEPACIDVTAVAAGPGNAGAPLVAAPAAVAAAVARGGTQLSTRTSAQLNGLQERQHVQKGSRTSAMDSNG
jgi:ZIP family zinc transporter